MLNEWSDRAPDDPPRSRWARAVDKVIAAVVLIGTIIFLVEIALRIF
jgi:hypothetical protein